MLFAVRRAARGAGALVALALSLTGCAGAGSGPSAFSALSRTPARLLIPRETSLEYQRSWGLRLVDAEAAFRAGLTGHGVTIAVIDTGLDNAPREVVRRASPASTDLVSDRGRGAPTGRHGGQVAQAVAADLDGGGVVGVAYGATLLSIRADIDGSCARECAFRSSDLARGVDYALAHGARIIVLAVQGKNRLPPSFEAALQRAADAGAVVVASAGNDGGDQPAWPARYAADPRFSRAVIAVGAVGPDGRVAPWSNRPGVASDRYLVAPGRDVLADCDGRTCSLLSGTSMSAPYVAGALALVMEARPDLSAQAAADLLLSTGRDVAAPSERALAGRGVLDIGRAMIAASRGGRA